MFTIYLTFRKKEQWAFVKPYARFIFMKRKTIMAIYILGFAFVIVRRDIEAVIIQLSHEAKCNGVKCEIRTSTN